jgi:uncharacterized protein (DUF427 family)
MPDMLAPGARPGLRGRNGGAKGVKIGVERVAGGVCRHAARPSACQPAAPGGVSTGRLGPRNQEGIEDMKAVWNGTVVAESDDTVVVEGNHYFPPESLKAEYLLPSNTRTMCSWKGQASYHTLFVDGDANPDAVWFYPDPKEAAAEIKGRVAFWKGVKVSE